MNSNMQNMTIGELESAWRSIKDRALRERDWVASSRLGQAAREIETAIGEALVSSGLVNDTVDAAATAASDVLNAGATVSETVAAGTGTNQNAVAATSTAGAEGSLVQQAIAAGQNAADLGLNVVACGAAGLGAGYVFGSKHPFGLGLLGAAVGAMFRPIRRTA